MILTYIQTGLNRRQAQGYDYGTAARVGKNAWTRRESCLYSTAKSRSPCWRCMLASPVAWKGRWCRRPIVQLARREKQELASSAVEQARAARSHRCRRRRKRLTNGPRNAGIVRPDVRRSIKHPGGQSSHGPLSDSAPANHRLATPWKRNFV